MHFFAVDAVANLLVADLLSRLHRGVNFFELVRRASAHDRSAEIAEVAVSLRARKDIEDDRCVRFDRPAALVMRIDALIAGRNDRVARQPALRHDRRIDRGLEHFRSQSRAVEIEIAVALGRVRLSMRIPASSPSRATRKRFGDLSDFDGGLWFRARPKRIAFDLHAEAFGAQLVGEQRGKICRHDQRADASFAKEQIENIDHAPPASCRACAASSDRAKATEPDRHGPVFWRGRFPGRS